MYETVKYEAGDVLVTIAHLLQSRTGASHATRYIEGDSRTSHYITTAPSTHIEQECV
jgi:hypothetical protein